MAAKRLSAATASWTPGWLLHFLLPQYRAEGKSYLTVSIGCTGGRHRSVALAEELAKRLGERHRAKVKVTHRDVLKV